LAVSLAFARAHAIERAVPLYEHFATIAGRRAISLPRMTINLFSGGKHGGGQMPIQDVLVVPASSKSIDEGLAIAYAVYYAAADRSSSATTCSAPIPPASAGPWRHAPPTRCCSRSTRSARSPRPRRHFAWPARRAGG